MTTTIAVRAATEADAGAILDLCLLVDLAQLGEPNTSIDTVRAQLTTSHLLAAVVDDPAGGLLGHAWVEHQPGFTKAWGDVVVRPGGERQVADTLFTWLCATSAQVAPGVPLQVFSDSTDTAKIRMLTAAGGTLVRRFYRMGIDLQAAAPFAVPDLGRDVTIRAVGSGEDDLRAMHAVIDVAFLDHFGHEPESFEMWREYTIDGACPDRSLWWLATVDGQPAAGLYACRLGEAGYVDSLGTLRAHRGRGLARALLLTAFAEFRGRGWPKAVLGVDATNPTGALGLYESAGMRAEHEGWRYELDPLAAGTG